MTDFQIKLYYANYYNFLNVLIWIAKDHSLISQKLYVATKQY